jgi:hypothetical protein
MTDDADDIDVALRRLDRPIPSDRSAERRRLMLNEFDRTSASHADPDPDGPLLAFRSSEVDEDNRRRKLPWVMLPAAAFVLVVALAVASRPPGTSTIPPAASIAATAPSTVDPVAERVHQFCAEDLAEVGNALVRYAAGDLGSGGNVGPLKEAVVDPLAALLDDLVEFGVPAVQLDPLRGDLETLETTYLQVQVTTQVFQIYEHLNALFAPGSLPGADRCDTDQLEVP